MKNKILIALGIMGLIFILFTSKNSDLTQEQMQPIYDAYAKGAVIIDVRTPNEYNAGHIDDAINIPVSKIENYFRKKMKTMDQSIIVYCRTGSRSGLVANYLRQGGLNVYDLKKQENWLRE